MKNLNGNSSREADLFTGQYDHVGSFAISSFQRSIGAGSFRRLFPVIKQSLLRPAYISGWNHCTIWNQELTDLDGVVYDVNSQYSSQMSTRALPYGVPEVIDRPTWEDVQRLRESGSGFVLRFIGDILLMPGHLPWVPSQESFQRSYIEDSHGGIKLTLCNVDLELLLKHYTVNFISLGKLWVFNMASGMFTRWIRKWYSVKSRAEQMGDAEGRQRAKLVLDSIVGKFGSKSKRVYLPVAIWVNAYSRSLIHHYATVCKKDFLYSSTDSLHLRRPRREIPVSSRMGDFKIERYFNRAKYIAKSVYLEAYYDDFTAKISGATQSAVDDLTSSGDPDEVFKRFAVGERLTNVINGNVRYYTLGDSWQW